MKKTISIKQIAELAGVSVATVSRVINQKGGYSAEVEQRIQKLIAEYHYTPNMMARGLQKSKASIIGILVPDIVNEHFAKMVLDLETEFFKNGYLTMVCNTNESSELEKRHLQAMVGQNVSGIILFSGLEEKLDMAGIPTIYINRRSKNKEEADQAIFLESDNEKGGYLAAAELADTGCKQIYFLSDGIWESSKKARYKGVYEALKERNICFDETHLLSLKDSEEDTVCEELEKFLKQLKEQGKVLDGLICTTDVLAAESILTLQNLGICVPKDVKVTGYDDITLARYFQVPLTTVHQPTELMAKNAAELLLQMIQGEAPKQRDYKVPVELVRRKSTENV